MATHLVATKDKGIAAITIVAAESSLSVTIKIESLQKLLYFATALIKATSIRAFVVTFGVATKLILFCHPQLSYFIQKN